MEGFWGSLSGDATTYLFPLENYLTNGSYNPDFRAPGLAPIYIPLRLLFSVALTCNIFLIIQLILSSLSVYVLAKAVYDVSKSKFLFYSVFYLFLISTYSNIFDVYFLTESLSTSLTVFLIYCAVQFYEGQQKKHLFISSILFAWLVFLRPINILFAPSALLLFYLLFRKKQMDLKQTFVSLIIFLSVFILADALWVIRNNKVHGEFIPLRKSVYYERGNSDYYAHLGQFVQSWGGDIMFWNPEAEIRWFNYKSDFVKTDFKPQLPDDIFTSEYNMDSLIKLRQLITDYPEKYNLPKEIIPIYDGINDKCKQYELALKREKPFVYHVVSRFRLFKKFLIHSGTYNLFRKKFTDLNLFQKAIKLFYTGLYIFLLAICLGGILFFPYRNKMFIFFLPVLLAVIVIPFGFKFCEYRYLVPAYPFMIASACYLAEFYFLKIRTFLKR